MKKPKRILVALKTTEHAIELTDIACRVGAQGASLVLMHVLELPPQRRSKRTCRCSMPMRR
jgi:hypothetical protein